MVTGGVLDVEPEVLPEVPTGGLVAVVVELEALTPVPTFTVAVPGPYCETPVIVVVPFATPVTRPRVLTYSLPTFRCPE